MDKIIQHEDEHDKISYDIIEDELEEIVFNSEITNEEILKSKEALKRGKSAGIVELVPEFFIHSIDIILPLLNRFFNRMFDNADFPSQWCYSVIVTLLKRAVLIFLIITEGFVF